jgi:hypothetical protein
MTCPQVVGAFPRVDPKTANVVRKLSFGVPRISGAHAVIRASYGSRTIDVTLSDTQAGWRVDKAELLNLVSTKECGRHGC